MNTSISRFIGTRDFYKRFLTIALPIVIQNLITNFVNLLDNLMVGQTGTDYMNAVSVVNQLMFVYHLCIWGAVSGAGIFTAQYYGKGDNDGVKYTFRAKIILVSFVSLLFLAIYLIFGDFLISRFLHQTDNVGNAQVTLECAKRYLSIILIELLPISLANAYGNTLRDMGMTKIPMVSGLCAVFINLFLNWVLIFGHLGFPAMGVTGAAIATVISRIAEVAIIVFYVHTHKEICPFIKGAFKSLRIPSSLMKNIIIKGLPLTVNETMWSLGLTILNQNYSLRGLAVVAAINIASTISNLFNVFYFAIGESISIIVGQLLGAERITEAKDTVRKMLSVSFCLCVTLAIIMALFRNVFPSIYKTEDEVIRIASSLILCIACFVPVSGLMHGCYFTIRTGGKTIITFLFDSGFLWVVSVPVAFCLIHFTKLDIIPVYATAQSMDILKMILGLYLVKKGVWINNLTVTEN